MAIFLHHHITTARPPRPLRGPTMLGHSQSAPPIHTHADAMGAPVRGSEAEQHARAIASAAGSEAVGGVGVGVFSHRARVNAREARRISAAFAKHFASCTRPECRVCTRMRATKTAVAELCVIEPEAAPPAQGATKLSDSSAGEGSAGVPWLHDTRTSASGARDVSLRRGDSGSSVASDLAMSGEPGGDEPTTREVLSWLESGGGDDGEGKEREVSPLPSAEAAGLSEEELLRIISQHEGEIDAAVRSRSAGPLRGATLPCAPTPLPPPRSSAHSLCLLHPQKPAKTHADSGAGGSNGDPPADGALGEMHSPRGGFDMYPPQPPGEFLRTHSLAMPPPLTSAASPTNNRPVVVGSEFEIP